MSDDQRPQMGPLREIVSGQSRKSARHAVSLACGHTAFVRGYATKMTRCLVCLRLAQEAWDKDHTCKHGVIKELEAYCIECHVDELMAQVIELKVEIHNLTAERDLLQELVDAMRQR